MALTPATYNPEMEGRMSQSIETQTINLPAVVPVWPQRWPEATAEANLHRASILVQLLDAVRELDLPQVTTWTVHAWDNTISGQLLTIDNDQRRRKAVAAWMRVLPEGFPHIKVYDDGATRIAARCQINGVLVEVWTAVNEPSSDAPVPAMPLPPATPSPLAQAATVVDPFADTVRLPAAPLVGTAHSVAPVEQLLQEV